MTLEHLKTGNPGPVAFDSGSLVLLEKRVNHQHISAKKNIDSWLIMAGL